MLLVYAEDKVHVLYSLTARALQKIVDGCGDKQASFMNIAVYEALVGVHYLLQVDGSVAIMRKRLVGIALLIEADDLLFFQFALDHSRDEDAPCKVASHRDEADDRHVCALFLP